MPRCRPMRQDYLSASTSRRLPGASRVLISILLVGALVGVGANYYIRCTPLPDPLDNPAPGTPVVVDFRGRALAVLGTRFARESYPKRLRDMGEWLPRATVGIEDRRFWNHPGVDLGAT